MINNFATRSFRDVADDDYVAARILHRRELALQFLWAAQQTLEKYFKAILLYNQVSTKDLSHDLLAALKRIGTITDIPFDFPADVREFIAYIDRFGPNRYFETPYYTIGDELLRLDRAVWHVRRYAQDLRTLPAGIKGDRLASELKRLHDAATKEHPERFRIAGGHLERILTDRQSPLRKAIVWKNFYYGANRKRAIRNYRMPSGSANPTHFLFEGAYDILERLVQFSKPVRQHFSGRPRTKS